MSRKIYLLLTFSAFLITMCRTYDQGGPVVAENGLSCQNYTNYGNFTQGAECFYQCPDATIRQPKLSEHFSTESELYTASRSDLDAQFCEGVSRPTPTIPPADLTPTLAAVVPSLTPTIEISPTAEVSPTASSPLLTGEVTLCDETLGLISFRMVETAPDLTDKVVTAQIGEHETACAVNPVNTSLLTCNLPSPNTFPARIIVSLDDAVVNDFMFDGIGCVLKSTPIP